MADELADWFGSARVMLLVGAILLYVASRAGVEALAGKEASPAKRAIGHWIPIAAAALVAMWIHRADLALSIIFATSIGCLSLLMGSICIVSPYSDAPPVYRRVWAFALPAGLLTLLAGFSGQLAWWQAGLLLIEGTAILFAWRELGGDVVAEAKIHLAESDVHRLMRWVNFVLCVIAAVIGAIAGVIGAKDLSQNLQAISDLATVVAVLAPLLVLPILTGGAHLAQMNRAGAAVTTGVGVVLLNLCLLLPIVVFLNYPAQLDGGWHEVLLKLPELRLRGPMPFPWVTWRVDNVVLVMLSFVLVPASLGRWKMGKAEGFVLIALYAVYVVMEAAGSMKA